MPTLHHSSNLLNQQIKSLNCKFREHFIRIVDTGHIEFEDVLEEVAEDLEVFEDEV
jgi:hypothetical protein